MIDIPNEFFIKYDVNTHTIKNKPTIEVIYTVSELLSEINQTFQKNYKNIKVTGEISNFSVHQSTGHAYFVLKDDKAQLNATMFRSVTEKLTFSLKDGLHVNCEGYIQVYPPQGKLQLIVQKIELVGQGNLYLEFEKLKNKLASEGLFDYHHKKELPLLPDNVFVITSPEGAAIHDFIKTARKRFPPARIILVPSSVQGESAPLELFNALCLAEKYSNPQRDVIALIRGGGSLEDLWAFNDERLIRRIFSCKTPVVSGVGHEIDFTLCDFVADKRAPTPTGAAQLIFPDIKHLKQTISSHQTNLLNHMQRKIYRLKNIIHKLEASLKNPTRILHENILKVDDLIKTMEKLIDNKIYKHKLYLQKLSHRLLARNPINTIEKKKQNIIFLKKQLDQLIQSNLQKYKKNLEFFIFQINTLNPYSYLNKGYSLVINEKNGKIVKSYDDVSTGDKLKIMPAKGVIYSKVIEIKEEK